MSSWVQTLVPYAEFSRVGFVNILAFRLRYFTGIITYFLNVTVYYFIWSAVYRGGVAIAGYNLAQMITYVSVGWMIRSFYWNTIDQEMAYEVIEGKIAMDLIKPVSVQWMWISRAIGESAFFIPIEMFELIRRHTPEGEARVHAMFAHPKIGIAIVLAVNVMIVWYLFQNRQRLFRHHH